MNRSNNTNDARRLARSLSLLMFVFMAVVSTVIFFTQLRLDWIDYLFILGAPLAMALIGYTVGRYHDSKASD